MKPGKVLIFSAPSGAGKTTIVRQLMARNPQLAFSISATTRAPRGQEIHGVDYHFLSEEEFKQRIESNEFAEYEEVYPGTYYGTLLREADAVRDSGRHLVLDVDVIGGLNLKKRYGSEALALYILPPSIDVLRDRLTKRGTESPEAIQTRVQKADLELQYAPQFDIRIVNQDLQAAIGEVEQQITNFTAQ